MSFLDLCLVFLAMELAWALMLRIAFRLWRAFQAWRRRRGINIDVILSDQYVSEEWERNSRVRARVTAGADLQRLGDRAKGAAMSRDRTRPTRDRGKAGSKRGAPWRS